jgi:hypothetical protein
MSLDDAAYEMTLDPPGQIVVIGAGPLGIEAALYGRYLGYEVTVFEKGDIGESLRASSDQPLPMLPDRCLSPLAVSALKAQDGGLKLPGDPTFPMTIGQWIECGLIRLAATDLLSGRVHTHSRVTRVELIPVEASEADAADADGSDEDDDYFIDGEVPPDYRLTIKSSDEATSFDAEAVIFATGDLPLSDIEGFDLAQSSAYLFRIGAGGDAESSDEARFYRGLQEIVATFAKLGGREALDLYRPIRF